IESHKKEIRRDLGNRIGKQVRIVPDLIFYIDKVEEEAMRLEALIRSLNIPPAPDDPKTSTSPALKLPLFIAGRYLFSKRKKNFINIISIISVLVVANITAALIVVLSVFNGLEELLRY